MIYLLSSFDVLRSFRNILHRVDSYIMCDCLVRIVSFVLIIIIVHSYKNLERECFCSYFRLAFIKWI